MNASPLALTPKLLSEDHAARYLGLSKRTLRNWRVSGKGPVFIKISSRCIRYKVADLDVWTDRQTRRSTSDLGILRGLTS